MSRILRLMFKKLENFDNKNNKDNIVVLNGIPFHTNILHIIPYFESICYDLSEFSQDTIKQFRLWLYEQEVVPQHNDIDKETFILFDFLSLDIPEFLFSSESKELFCYLLTRKYSYDILKLLRHIKVENINEIICNVFPSYFSVYLKKMSNDSFVILRNKLKNETNYYDINNYATMLQHGLGGEKNEKLARELYWKNWEENKDSDSLHNYAYMLYHLGGKYCLGGKKYFVKARELYWKNWEENKNSDSLHSYAYMLEHCIGGEKDLVKARELYLKNWEENIHIFSLRRYVYMLERGLGGEKNIQLAEQYYKNFLKNQV